MFQKFHFISSSTPVKYSIIFSKKFKQTICKQLCEGNHFDIIAIFTTKRKKVSWNYVVSYKKFILTLSPYSPLKERKFHGTMKYHTKRKYITTSVSYLVNKEHGKCSTHRSINKETEQSFMWTCKREIM